MTNFLVYKIAHSGTLAEVIHESNGVSGVQTLCTSLYAIHESQEFLQALSLTVQGIYVFGRIKRLASPKNDNLEPFKQKVSVS